MRNLSISRILSFALCFGPLIAMQSGCAQKGAEDQGVEKPESGPPEEEAPPGGGGSAEPNIDAPDGLSDEPEPEEITEFPEALPKTTEPQSTVEAAKEKLAEQEIAAARAKVEKAKKKRAAAEAQAKKIEEEKIAAEAKAKKAEEDRAAAEAKAKKEKQKRAELKAKVEKAEQERVEAEAKEAEARRFAERLESQRKLAADLAAMEEQSRVAAEQARAKRLAKEKEAQAATKMPQRKIRIAIIGSDDVLPLAQRCRLSLETLLLEYFKTINLEPIFVEISTCKKETDCDLLINNEKISGSSPTYDARADSMKSLKDKYGHVNSRLFFGMVHEDGEKYLPEHPLKPSKYKERSVYSNNPSRDMHSALNFNIGLRHTIPISFIVWSRQGDKCVVSTNHWQTKVTMENLVKVVKDINIRSPQ